MPLIPDRYVRDAFISLLSGIGVPIYESRVPKNIDPMPAQRVILSTQMNSQHNTSKCGHNWQHYILLDIISENPQGYSNKSVVDDIFNSINILIDLNPGDISIPPFVIYNTQMADSHDMELDTPVTTINRKLVRYSFIMSGGQSTNFLVTSNGDNLVTSAGDFLIVS